MVQMGATGVKAEPDETSLYDATNLSAESLDYFNAEPTVPSISTRARNMKIVGHL